MRYTSEDTCAAEQQAFTVAQNASSPPRTTLARNYSASVCRYYQAGYCRRGSTCHFAHGSKADQSEAGHPKQRGQDYIAYLPDQTPVYHPRNSQAPSLLLWQPYSSSFSPSFDPRYGLLQSSDASPDYPDDTSDPSSSEFSSSTTNFDRDVRAALESVRTKGSGSPAIRGLVGPHGDFGVSLSREYAINSGFKAEAFRGRAASMGNYFSNWLPVVYSQPIFLPLQDDLRKKPLAYKTKPCRFFATNGKCTSGNKCTFIHEVEPEKGKSSPDPELPGDAHLPPKPVNKYDDYKTKDYYPISWRVIGGGVMMGGERRMCRAFLAGHCKYGEDCKLAHETELDEDPDGVVELKIGVISTGDKSPSEPPKRQATQKAPRRTRSHKRKSLKVQCLDPNQVEGVQPMAHDPKSQTVSNSNDTRVRDGPAGSGRGWSNEKEVVSPKSQATTSPLHRRTRSMTIPTSPPLPHITSPNYAAEL
ncbi:hypothetical protein HYDPIDRAFT_114172 [Hydnomerulius pinastri MD-312]|uniref:C3H1-type domain-containing protein n=1 Tax=Hydnomerulius pinastri MD-312 TaxID=994086 RepID=A0A0C9W6I1_9AGAM|nr:hypothetical protein HYDPIDRAFT_114172 [Hydnomerulius pinastri MD-312]